jgi:hypothetical protein
VTDEELFTPAVTHLLNCVGAPTTTITTGSTRRSWKRSPCRYSQQPTGPITCSTRYRDLAHVCGHTRGLPARAQCPGSRIRVLGRRFMAQSVRGRDEGTRHVCTRIPPTVRLTSMAASPQSYQTATSSPTCCYRSSPIRPRGPLSLTLWRRSNMSTPFHSIHTNSTRPRSTSNASPFPYNSSISHRVH